MTDRRSSLDRRKMKARTAVGSEGLQVAAAAVAMVLTTSAALAQETLEDHFRGKTLTVIVPTTPGGDRMGNAAPFIRYFGRHIPGNPNVVPSFMPGAGGAV